VPAGRYRRLHARRRGAGAGAGPPAHAVRPRGRLAADIALAAALAAVAWTLPALAVRQARPAVLNFGPNDVDYVTGFREDWERDRLTRFHWALPHATVRLPLLVSGDGHRVVMRVRRHLIEPSRVTIRAEGRTVTSFEIQADPRVAYRTIEVPLPPLEGRAPLVLTIDSVSADPRPLGLAFDWLEVRREAPTARFALLHTTRLELVLVVLAAFAAPLLAGASRRAAAIHASLIALVATAGSAWDVLATERIAREGFGTYSA